jgi:hypothetical protein
MLPTGVFQARIYSLEKENDMLKNEVERLRSSPPPTFNGYNASGSTILSVPDDTTIKYAVKSLQTQFLNSDTCKDPEIKASINLLVKLVEKTNGGYKKTRKQNRKRKYTRKH